VKAAVTGTQGSSGSLQALGVKEKRIVAILIGSRASEIYQGKNAQTLKQDWF